MSILLAAILVVAPSPPPSAAPANEVTLGVVGVTGDRTSPEFLEYRDLPEGFVVPAFRLSGRMAGLDYDLSGRDAGQDDQRYRALVGNGRFQVRGLLADLPHHLGDGRTPFGEGAVGAQPLAGALQRSAQDAVDARAATGAPLDYPFLAPIAGDILRGGRNVALAVARRDAALEVALQPGADLAVHARYGERRREGQRASGVGFGLRNAVEVAEPVDDETRTISLGAELDRRWGVLTAAVQYDAYRNDVTRLVVDNPFRATDATAPGAPLGPNDRTTAGARQAEVALAPDNDAVTANAGASVRLPLRTRLTADASIARWRQVDAPLPEFTANAAIVAPALPISSVNGDIHLDAQTVHLTSSPWAGLSVRARVRRAAMDNRTPRAALPGVARLDAVFEAVPRRTVPYSNTRTRVEASAGYHLKSWRLEAGHRQEDIHRTFRETERTTETAWTGAVSAPLPADGHLRLHYEHGHRGFDAYDSRASSEASRVTPRPPRSLGAGRRYDQAVRDRDAAGARLELAPVETLVLAASYTLEARRYPLTPYGLVRTRAHVASADASLAPGGRWSAHAFYALELESSFQRVRHSPLPSISIDLRDIWDARLGERVHSLGAGFDRAIGAGTTARVEGTLQRADGVADFFSAPGGDPDLAEDIPEFDDVRFASVSAEVEHRVAAGWSVSAGVWWEAQSVSDSIDEGRPDYVPGAFVLAPRRLDYGAVAFQARITRRW